MCCSKWENRTLSRRAHAEKQDEIREAKNREYVCSGDGQRRHRNTERFSVRRGHAREDNPAGKLTLHEPMTNPTRCISQSGGKGSWRGLRGGSGRIRGIFFRQRAPAPTSPLHAESSPATKSAVVHTFSPPPPPIQFLTRNRPRKRSGRSGRSRVAAGLVERRPARIVSAIKACKGRSIEDIPNPQVEKPRTRPAPTQNGVGGNAPQMDTRLLCPSMNLYCGPLTMYSCCPCSIE